MHGYCDSILGKQVVRGSVVRVRATGERVRFHGIRKWGKLYWTCDRAGEVFAVSKADAYLQCPDNRREVLL